VRIERMAGDQDVTVSAGAALTFTRANWATPQMVTVGAAADADGADDSATIQVSLEGRTPRMVAVTVDDDDPPAPDAAPDASATPDAGAIPDAATDASTRDGAVVADAPVSDAPTPDGSAATDTRRNDGGVPVSTGGGGCGCRTGDTSPAPVSLIPVLLIAALRARRRR
jgi:MYXO-CTERM domain-containing protein